MWNLVKYSYATLLCQVAFTQCFSSLRWTHAFFIFSALITNYILLQWQSQCKELGIKTVCSLSNVWQGYKTMNDDQLNTTFDSLTVLVCLHVFGGHLRWGKGIGLRMWGAEGNLLGYKMIDMSLWMHSCRLSIWKCHSMQAQCNWLASVLLIICHLIIFQSKPLTAWCISAFQICKGKTLRCC